MKLIIGLGNPGREYEKTRHNAGFLVVDELAKMMEPVIWKNELKAQTAKIRVDGEKVLLVKPQTFMNLSGEAVGGLAQYYKVEIEDIIVVYDDMDLPVGTIRIRKKGSDGGHNGMKSIIAHLGSSLFPRIRVGVGRPAPGWTVINHVLAVPTLEEKTAFQAGIKDAAVAAKGILELGLDIAMNRFNPKHRT